jgi:hypothetical protein
MCSFELVVAIRGDHQSRHALHPAAEHLHDVERGLVCPVEVLEHENRRDRAELPAKGVVHLVRRRTGLEQVRHRSARRACDVRERSERAGGEERSHAPWSTRVGRTTDAQNARTSDVLPMPASPATSMSRPLPALASEYAPWSAASAS